MVRDDPAAPIRVLIAEDDKRARFALRVFLSGHPRIEVVAESDRVADTLVLAREHAPSVVLVDVYLPTKDDGLGLLRALTGELGIPVVAISIEAGVRDSALGAGASRFVEKARVPDELVAALESCGDHAR